MRMPYYYLLSVTNQLVQELTRAHCQRQYPRPVTQGIRVKPYLTQIVSTILWQWNNKSAKVRQQVMDLTTRLAIVIKQCGED